jgi:hypothetical protein
MIVYGTNRSPLAHDSNQDLASMPETTASAAVRAPVLAEGSGELSARGSIGTEDDDDIPPIIIKK